MVRYSRVLPTSRAFRSGYITWKRVLYFLRFQPPVVFFDVHFYVLRRSFIFSFFGFSERPQESERSEALAGAQQKRYDGHVNSPGHRQKFGAFTHYKRLYEDEVAPLLNREKSLHNVLQKSSEEENASTEATDSRDVELDLQRLKTASEKLKTKVRVIESNRKWDQANTLHEAIKTLDMKLKEVEKIVHEGKAKPTQPIGNVQLAVLSFYTLLHVNSVRSSWA